MHGAPQQCSNMPGSHTSRPVHAQQTGHDDDVLLAHNCRDVAFVQGPNDMQLVTLMRREVAAAVVKDGESVQCQDPS